jgi:hypothetical protein
MNIAINFFKPTLVASCLTMAACSGGGSTGSTSSPNSGAATVTDASAVDASVVKAAAAATTTSPNGTTIPSATQIVDASGNLWIVTAGVIYENGALAGYSNAVTRLLYDNKLVYQENSAGGWWSWNGTTWVAGSPPAINGVCGTANATTVKTAPTTNLCSTGAASALSGSGPWTWSCAAVISGTTASCAASLAPPAVVASPNGTSIPASKQIVDSSGNVWTVVSGVIYKQGAVAGYSSGVTMLLYDNNTIYQENAAGGWWSWSGSTWASSTEPVAAATTPTISGSPVTTDTTGQAYSFVPSTTNPGGGALSFSVSNLPAWAKFSTTTGAVTGTPTSVQVGAYPNIGVSVSNGTASASLAAFSITVTAGSANLSWTAPTDNTNGTPLTNLAGYTISYGTSPTALTQTIQAASPTETTYVVNNLSAGTYYFAVDAYTTTGTQSAESATGTKTVQ